MGRVEGKVAFITGAARGQGRSHAVRLAEEGADIIAIDICEDIEGTPYPGATKEDLDRTVALVSETGRSIVASVADVRDQDAITTALDRGVSQFGALDIVVANAGISTDMETADQLSERSWNNMLDTNLSGVWRTAKAAIPHLKAHGRGGSMILTSSAAGLRGYEHSAHYVAAKHGIVGLMRTLAQELGRHNIRVNSVHPTQVDTDMIMNEPIYRLFAPHLEHPTKDDFAPISEALQLLPVPWVDPVDISNAVLFLASDEARYITGVTLPVDAGTLQK